MSVDAVIFSITSVRRSFERNPENFSLEGKRKLLLILDCMRDPLMEENIEGFNNYINSLLAREPDAADFVLEELFDELGINTRDELNQLLET